MADIATTAPIAIRRSTSQRLDRPKTGLGARLAALCGAVGGAFKLAYVDPYSGLDRRPEAVEDDGLEGRDPSW